MGGGKVSERRRRYREEVERELREGLPESPWAKVLERLALGSRQFVAALLEGGKPSGRQPKESARERPTLAAIIQVVEEFKGERWEVLRQRHGDWGRELVLKLGREIGGLSLRELGEAAGTNNPAAVSMALKRFGQRQERDREVRDGVQKAKQLLSRTRL